MRYESFYAECLSIRHFKIFLSKMILKTITWKHFRLWHEGFHKNSLLSQFALKFFNFFR